MLLDMLCHDLYVLSSRDSDAVGKHAKQVSIEN